MGIYRKIFFPRLCDLVMGNELLRPYRRRVVGGAHGEVLEIGVGSGLNFEFYPDAAHEIIALEPDPELIEKARRRAEASSPRATLLNASAECLPLEDDSVDTVVTTWTLCTIPDASRALEEMRRVLRPSGTLLFVEHGLAPELNVRKWQHRLTPLWGCISGGCRLNRPIDELITTAGFSIDQLSVGYGPGPKTAAYFYEGSARPR